MGKTPYDPTLQTMASDPFNRVRWNFNEIQGKFEAAVRALMSIRESKDLNKARQTAAEALQIMARETQKI